MRSLETRLQTGLLLTLVILIGLGWWGVSTATRNIAVELLVSRLEHDAESLLSALQIGEQGALHVQGDKIDVIYDRPYSGHYYVIRTPDESPPLRSRSLWDTDLSVPILAPGLSIQDEISGPDGQRLLLRVAGYSKLGRELTIGVAEDLSALVASLSDLRVWFAATTVGALLLLGLLQRRVIYEAFRPLRHVSGAVDRLATGDLAQLDENVPLEVQPLVKEVNRLLVLLNQRLQRSRNATGNLAHSLKTPLTLLRQLADHPDLEGLPRCRETLDQQVTRLQGLIDVELKRARVAGQASAGQRFHPRQDIADLLTVLKRVYDEKTLDFETEIRSTGDLRADRNDMQELVGNLLDNACKWARRRVRCSLLTDPKVVLAVEDDGPGCTPEMLEQLTQRGRRVDESTPGHGLGLAIAAEIADTYGADLVFDRSEALGGFRVRAVFPNSILQT